MKRNAAFLTVGALFLVGVFVGVLGTHLVYAKMLKGGIAAVGVEVFPKVLDRRLDLTPEQKLEIEAILDDSREQAQQLRREIQPRSLEILETTNDRIEALLTPEQNEEFQKIRARHRRLAGRFLLGVQERNRPAD